MVLESFNVVSVANNVGRAKFIESFIAGQNHFISAGRVIYDCGSLHVIYPNSPAAPMTLMDLTLFVGVLTQILECEEIMLPTPREWKAGQQKEETKEEINTICDSNSKRNIVRDLSSIALHKQHNAYDAMGLGIYALKVKMGQLAYPKMYYQKAA